MEYFFSTPARRSAGPTFSTTCGEEAYFGEEKIVNVNIRRLRMKVERRTEQSAPHRHSVGIGIQVAGISLFSAEGRHQWRSRASQSDGFSTAWG